MPGSRVNHKTERIAYCREVPHMPFEKVETSVDFPSLERMILKFWDDNGIFRKAAAR